MIGIIWRLLSQRISLPCPAWLHWLVAVDNPFARACHAKIIIENLDLAPGMKVLDAGAGSGRVTIPLAEKLGVQVQVTAMDIQKGMLDVIQKKAQEKNLHNILFLHAGLGNGVLRQNYYDRVILVTVLGEIPNQRAALQELYNAIKPGGILSVSEMVFDPHYQSKQTVIDVAKAAGFREKKSFGNRFAYTIQFEK
jgi:ubiquinone/menaquinone biosynthesis C-methylase UbiE